MAEYDYDAEHDDVTPEPARRKRRMDPMALGAGILTLLVSAYVLTDGTSWLPVADLRWVLAGGAILIGLLMLVASVAGNKDKRST